MATRSGNGDALLGVFIGSGIVTVLGAIGFIGTFATAPSKPAVKTDATEDRDLLDFQLMSQVQMPVQQLRKTVPPSSNTLINGCNDILINFNKYVDEYVADVKEYKKPESLHAHIFDPWDRVGKIAAHYMHEFSLYASTLISKEQPLALLEERANGVKLEFANKINAICGILCGSFFDRLRDHVARILATLDGHASSGPGMYMWLQTEAGFYSTIPDKKRPTWDAANDMEANLLNELYTQAAVRIGKAPSFEDRARFKKQKLPELEKNISAKYNKGRTQQTQQKQQQ